MLLGSFLIYLLLYDTTILRGHLYQSGCYGAIEVWSTTSCTQKRSCGESCGREDMNHPILRRRFSSLMSIVWRSQLETIWCNWSIFSHCDSHYSTWCMSKIGCHLRDLQTAIILLVGVFHLESTHCSTPPRTPRIYQRPLRSVYAARWSLVNTPPTAHNSSFAACFGHFLDSIELYKWG